MKTLHSYQVFSLFQLLLFSIIYIIIGLIISDELVVSSDVTIIRFNVCEFVFDINHYQFTIQVTAPCNSSLLNDYTYTLLQRDYCQRPLNSSQINVSIDDINDTTLNTLISISVNVQSLILDSTWSISVQVSNRFGNDTTAYTNITNTGNVFTVLLIIVILSQR